MLLAKVAVQITLLGIFWMFFGRPSLDRFAAGRVLVTSSKASAGMDGILPPAVTICARNTSTGLGWRRRHGDITVIHKDILRYQCGQDENITACVEQNTFNLTEVVGDVSKGGTDMMDPNFWSGDFTWTIDGRCYTLHYPNPVKDDFREDQIIIESRHLSLFQIIFIHDPRLFLNNYNPQSLPMTRRKLLSSESYFTMITLVEHQLLNRPSEPCMEDLNYSFLACVKESFSRRVGCRLAWDTSSHRDRPVCTTMEQFSRFEDLYERVSDKATPFIENATGCIRPCFYKEYKVVGKILNTDPLDGVTSYFGLWYVTTEMTVERSSLVYPLTSLVAEFGGTLGLFLGFSFMMLWDGAILATEVLHKIWSKK